MCTPGFHRPRWQAALRERRLVYETIEQNDAAPEATDVDPAEETEERITGLEQNDPAALNLATRDGQRQPDQLTNPTVAPSNGPNQTPENQQQPFRLSEEASVAVGSLIQQLRANSSLAGEARQALITAIESTLPAVGSPERPRAIEAARQLLLQGTNPRLTMREGPNNRLIVEQAPATSGGSNERRERQPVQPSLIGDILRFIMELFNNMRNIDMDAVMQNREVRYAMRQVSDQINQIDNALRLNVDANNRPLSPQVRQQLTQQRTLLEGRRTQLQNQFDLQQRQADARRDRRDQAAVRTASSRGPNSAPEAPRQSILENPQVRSVIDRIRSGEAVQNEEEMQGVFCLVLEQGTPQEIGIALEAANLAFGQLATDESGTATPEARREFAGPFIQEINSRLSQRAATGNRMAINNAGMVILQQGQQIASSQGTLGGPRRA